MVTKNKLQELIKSYDREGAWVKLEALYIRATSIDGFFNACRNIEIRYGTNKPVEDVKSDIVRLCNKDRIPYETEDAGGKCKKIITKACEQVFPKFLTEKVSHSILSLSKIAKRFVFLLYEEGSILNGRIWRSDETVLSYYTPAYKIIFGELEGNEYKVHEEVLQEMIAAGLVYDCFWSNRKHFYYDLVVPPFAKGMWSKLPDIISLPVINVEKAW